MLQGSKLQRHRLFHKAAVAQGFINLPQCDKCQQDYLSMKQDFLLQDLAMYINEVKRDNETLKKISEFQSSIENLVSSSFLMNFSELQVPTAWETWKSWVCFQLVRLKIMVQSNKRSRREISAGKEWQLQKRKQLFKLFLRSYTTLQMSQRTIFSKCSAHAYAHLISSL